MQNSVLVLFQLKIKRKQRFKIQQKIQYSTPILTLRKLNDLGRSVGIHIVFANYCNDTFSLPEYMLELATFKNQKGLGEKKIISYDKIKSVLGLDIFLHLSINNFYIQFSFVSYIGMNFRRI